MMSSEPSHDYGQVTIIVYKSDVGITNPRWVPGIICRSDVNLLLNQELTLSVFSQSLLWIILHIEHGTFKQMLSLKTLPWPLIITGWVTPKFCSSKDFCGPQQPLSYCPSIHRQHIPNAEANRSLHSQSTDHHHIATRNALYPSCSCSTCRDSRASTRTLSITLRAIQTSYFYHKKWGSPCPFGVEKSNHIWLAFESLTTGILGQLSAIVRTHSICNFGAFKHEIWTRTEHRTTITSQRVYLCTGLELENNNWTPNRHSAEYKGIMWIYGSATKQSGYLWIGNGQNMHTAAHLQYLFR